MDISKVEGFMGSVINKEVLKKALGDGPEFEIIYEALMKDDESNFINNKESSSNYTSTGVGQKLESIPLRIRTEPVDKKEVFLINNLNEIINNHKSKDVSSYNRYLDSNIDNSTDIDKINKSIDKYSEKYGVDKNLILAIIKQESNFNPNAVSYAGAKGLMQLMDFNSEAYGLTNPFDIDQNIEGGVKHIKSYLNMFNGNLAMALMAYNGGPGTMERRGVKSANDLYKMPEETQNYVPKILSLMNI